MTPLSVIQLIHAAGGKAILAHPELIHNHQLVKEILTYGLDGIEAYHPIHQSEAVNRYLAMANENHLLVTGGSDYHAIPGRFPEQLGIYTIDYELLEKLRQSLSVDSTGVSRDS